MNKSETIMLFQQIILRIEKLEKKQVELSDQLIQTSKTIIENQKIIYSKIKEIK